MSRYLGQLKLIFNDKNKKKNVFKIFTELVNLGISKKELPLFYGGKYLYRAENSNYKDYLSTQQEYMVRFSKGLHKLEYTTLLKNKLASALYFEECGMSIPKMTSYTVGDIFFTEDGRKEIRDKAALATAFDEVMDKNGMAKLFVKALAESGGVGCYLLQKEDLEEQIEEMGDEMMQGSFVHQEVLVQHKEINKIYPDSINTLRFETYIDNTGKTHILSALMRFGIAGSFVDNASSGGFYVAIDMENECLKGKGFQKMKAGAGGRLFDEHPDTGYKVDGFKLPYFKEACELVKQAVRFVPERYIGWDIAITHTGPVVIEGNGSPHVILADIAYGGYLKHPLYPEILQEASKGWSPRLIPFG